MDNRPIGLFDSGVGGLTVLRDLHEILPNESYIYFGDTKNLPYGSKSKDELVQLVKNIFDFFLSKNVKAAIMACNTTSATVYDVLKDDYDFNIYPVIQSSSKSIAEKYSGTMGVLATQATVNSHKYKFELLKFNPALIVVEQACADWVKIVEEGLYDTEGALKSIKNCLIPIQEKGCKNIILGCTHYPYLVPYLKKITGESVQYINPAEFFVKNIISDLAERDLLSSSSTGSEEFFVSSSPKSFVEAAKVFYDVPFLPQIVSL